MDAGRTPRSVDPDDGNLYGAHWWTRDEPLGTFWAAGHDGQYLDVCPALDLVVVRLGRTDVGPFAASCGPWRDEVDRRLRAPGGRTRGLSALRCVGSPPYGGPL